MVEESNIAAGCRCDDRSSQDTKIPAFVPPRPRDRRRLGKGDSRAGYWCRRTACLAKKVAVASREAREATKLVRDMVDMVVHSHKHTHTPHPHTPEGSESGSSRGSAKGSSPSDMECGGSPGGVRAGAHNVDCDSDGSKAMVVQAVQQVRQEFQAAHERQLHQMKEQIGEMKQFLVSPMPMGMQLRELRRLQAAVRGRCDRQRAQDLRVGEQVQATQHAAAVKIQAAYRGLRRRAYEFGGCVVVGHDRWDDYFYRISHDVLQVASLRHIHSGSLMHCIQRMSQASQTFTAGWWRMSHSEWRSIRWGWHRSVRRQCIFAVRDIDELISQGVCSLEHVLRLRRASATGMDASLVQRVLASVFLPQAQISGTNSAAVRH